MDDLKYVRNARWVDLNEKQFIRVEWIEFAGLMEEKKSIECESYEYAMAIINLLSFNIFKLEGSETMTLSEKLKWETE